MEDRKWQSAIAVVIGCMIAAVSFNMFLIPNSIAAGGFSGLGILFNRLLGIPVGTAIILLNIPLFIVAFTKLGKKFILVSALGTLIYSIAIDVIRVPTITNDLVLCAIYGGLGVGTGFGLILKYGATTGGVDMLAKLFTLKVKEFPIGMMMFIIDLAVILASILIIGFEEGMYAILTVFLSSKVIDIIIEGANKAKAFFIITSQPDLIANEIMEKLERGVTEWHGRGVYTDHDKKILLCAVNNRSEIMEMKAIIRRNDRRAFVLIADTREVLGEGFYDLTEER